MVGVFLFDDQAYRFKKENKKLKRKNVWTAKKKKKKAIENQFNRYLEKYASAHCMIMFPGFNLLCALESSKTSTGQFSLDK